VLHVLQLEELEALLLELSALVSRLERRDPGFPEGLLGWLSRTETALGNSRLPAAGELAALRGRLLAAGRGSLPADLHLRGRATKRRVREAASAAVLEQAGAAVRAAIGETRARVGEAERVLRQVLAVAQQKALSLYVAESGRTAQLAALLAALRRDPDLGAAATHAVGLVGAQDALILLDRTLSVLETSVTA
jgi:hypothetical protein